MDKLRDRFKEETGKDVDIKHNVFAQSVISINRDYVLWLEKKVEKQCMYCEKELEENEAIIICKDCAK